MAGPAASAPIACRHREAMAARIAQVYSLPRALGWHGRGRWRLCACAKLVKIVALVLQVVLRLASRGGVEWLTTVVQVAASQWHSTTCARPMPRAS